MINYYDILNIEQDASENDIKKAYRIMAKITHPDVAKNPKIDFKLINEVYVVLSSPTLKASYNRKLNEHQQFGIKTYGEDIDLNYNFDRRKPFSRDPKVSEIILTILIKHIEHFLSEKPENDVDILFDEFASNYFKEIILPELRSFLNQPALDGLDVTINYNNVYPIFNEIWSKYKYCKMFSNKHFNTLSN